MNAHQVTRRCHVTVLTVHSTNCLGSCALNKRCLSWEVSLFDSDYYGSKQRVIVTVVVVVVDGSVDVVVDVVCCTSSWIFFLHLHQASTPLAPC
jgi:hypothetical protein